jgi:hypothetical protein
VERFSVVDRVDVLGQGDGVAHLICGRRNAYLLRLVDAQRCPQIPLARERQASARQESRQAPHSSYGELGDLRFLADLLLSLEDGALQFDARTQRPLHLLGQRAPPLLLAHARWSSSSDQQEREPALSISFTPRRLGEASVALDPGAMEGVSVRERLPLQAAWLSLVCLSDGR